MIDIKNLTVRFGDKLVLDDVSCQIETGKITSIIGKSGMGKSVLMKAVLGLIPTAVGEIRVDGVRCSMFGVRQSRAHLTTDGTNATLSTGNPTIKHRIPKTAYRKPNMAMLFQNSALFDSYDVFQNIAFPVFEHTKKSYNEIRELVQKMVSLVNLPDVLDVYPAALSGGMRKRVALARAIIQEPDYLIYDEPTTGLDPVTADDIIKLIGTIHQKLSMTSIIITHDPECIKQLTENLIMIDERKIIFCDTFEHFKTFDHPTAKAFREHIFFVGSEE